MIPGRTNVGDVQGRRLLAILDLKANKHVWADASAFAGVERKAKPADPDAAAPAQLGLARVVRRRRAQRRRGALAGQQGSLVREDRSARPARRRSSTTCTTTRGFASRTSAARLGRRRGWRGCRTTSASCSCRRSPATCTCYSARRGRGAPAKPLTSGKWEVTSAQLSADRSTLFLTTNEVHPGERHFYTMPVDGGARTR